MNRNRPDYLQEKDARTSATDTRRWIEDVKDKYKNIKPILTPRFTPSCSDELMGYLCEIQKNINFQCNPIYLKTSVKLHGYRSFAQVPHAMARRTPNLICSGETSRTIMAHCVHCPDKEIEMMRGRCICGPLSESNSNLSSGIAPIRKYLERGVKVGMGSDIAGGTVLSLFFAMAEAVRCSKLYWRLVDNSVKPLSMEEVF